MLKHMPYGTYIFFGLLTFLGAAFIWIFFPETKGLSLEEMDVLFGSVGFAQADDERMREINREVGLEEVVRHGSAADGADIFDEKSGRPVAWAFVGVDSSLTTLHVEEDFRRRGLAKLLTVRLFETEMDGFWEEGQRKLAFGYVIVGNEASAGMCKSLGGQSDWECYWLRIDLGQVSL